MKNILDKLGKEMLFFEGAMGTMLQAEGLCAGELPEKWNITHPDIITNVHLSYLNAGADIIKLNTFGANRLKFPDKDELREVVSSAFAAAERAIERSGREDVYKALDIGPCGRLLKPMGDMAFEEAVSIFGELASMGEEYGADVILIETMNDIYETKAAVLGAKENSSLPIFVTNAYDMSGTLMTGATPEAVCAVLEGLGVSAMGINCSFGPKEMKPIVASLAKCSSIPLIVCPNAGLPSLVDGVTRYDTDAEEFAMLTSELVSLGVHIAGGCCGTSPEYIRALRARLSDYVPEEVSEKNLSVISSYTHALYFGQKPLIIGERINPTGKKRFKEALKANDIDYILHEAISQEEAGAHILDVNVGLPDIDEPDMMKRAVTGIQAVCALPLQIDTSDITAMEKAMRLYNGKPMINSVNGKKESMEAVFPLVKKYGGVVVALTLDEDGIPETAEGRIAIAEKIYKKAEGYGIAKKDIIIDTLTMTVSTSPDSAKQTLGALESIALSGGNTVLGVSNISFGLPQRDFVNSVFFTMALNRGLSAGIINPLSVEMMKAYRSYMALGGMDENCSEYIDFASSVTVGESKVQSNKKDSSAGDITLSDAIASGLVAKSGELASELLKTVAPLEVINSYIVPSLDRVGRAFEEKKLYLPQLLVSADAAKSAFDAVKNYISKSGGQSDSKCAFVIATVEGDIHDIGKNIVKVLLDNYGYRVIDLGKDVPPETIVRAVGEHNAPMLGLSALMTTTLPAMAETVRLAKEKYPALKIVVGGAVLTKEYADAIGADKYASDAMEAVRYAEEINKNL